jgi:site-specific DNA-methyltransferase (adenine-specific)
MITSPPYNVDLGNNEYKDGKCRKCRESRDKCKCRQPYDVYKDNKDHNEFIEGLKYSLGVLKPKMVKGGRVCINIGDGKNGLVPTHSDITQFMVKELDYLIKTTIIWNKNQIGNRTSWGSFKSPSNPSFPTPFEYILVFCNETQSKSGDPEEITVSKEEFIDNSLALWTFAPESQMKKFSHPAMFPIELPYRLIQQLSYKEDVVLDIFSGAGTTCLAAAMLGRRWIGFELSEEYVERSRKRVRQYTDQTRF